MHTNVRKVALFIILLSLLPVVFAVEYAYYGMRPEMVSIYTPSGMGYVQPGEYNIILFPFGPVVGSAYFPPARAFLSLRASYGLPSGWVWQGFYFLPCPEGGCNNWSVFEAVRGEFPPGVAFGTPVYVGSPRGMMAVVPVFATFRRADFGLFWYLSPAWVADSEKNIVYFPPNDGRVFTRPHIPDSRVVEESFKYVGMYSGGEYTGYITYRLTLPFSYWDEGYYLATSVDGYYLATEDDVVDEHLSIEDVAHYLNIAGHCSPEVTADDLKDIPYFLVPSDEPRTGRMTTLVSVECDYEGYYPIQLTKFCENCRLLGPTDAFFQKVYGEGYVTTYLFLLFKEFDPKLYSADLRVPELVSPHEEEERETTPVEQNQPSEEQREERGLPACITEVDLRRTVVVDKEVYPVIHPYDDPYPRRVVLRLVFDRGCVFDDNLYLEYYGLTYDNRREKFYFYDVSEPDCSSGTCMIDFPVPLTGYRYIQVTAGLEEHGGSFPIFSHTRSGKCVQGKIFIGTGEKNVEECALRCGSGGCDLASPEVRASIKAKYRDPIGGIIDAWKVDPFGALLYGGMGTASAVLSNLSTVTEFVRTFGVPAAVGAVALEFFLFFFAYGLASRCTEGEKMGLFTAISFLVAPFFGSLGALALAGITCLISKLS